jgi:hypothetical protein
MLDKARKVPQGPPWGLLVVVQDAERAVEVYTAVDGIDRALALGRLFSQGFGVTATSHHAHLPRSIDVFPHLQFNFNLRGQELFPPFRAP